MKHINFRWYTSLAVAAFTLFAASAVATAAEIENAELRRIDAAGNPDSAIAALLEGGKGDVWVTWTVPALESGHSICCFDYRQRESRTKGSCSLGRENSWNHQTDAGGDADLRVVLQLRGGELRDLRSYTTDCRLDAGGDVVYELDGVGASDSARFLASLIPTDRKPRGTADDALTSLALHAGPVADAELIRRSEPPVHPELRSQTAFWLGVARGRAGYERLREMLAGDPTRSVREQVVFALSQSDEPEATELLIRTARSDDDAEIRSKALFWLAQQAGERAAATIGGAIENDPDAEVREHAVFALSQLPRGEGVPLLLDLARTSKYPEVREKALFWLGQSDDPRALEVIQEILER